MSIDLRSETLASLVQAARLLPPSRQGRPVSPSCVFRWIKDGVKTIQGRVRLEAVRLGGRWLTSVEALERFAAAQTPDHATERPQLPRTSPARRRASERAERELAQRGI